MKETKLLESDGNIVYYFLEDPLFNEKCLDPLAVMLKPGSTVLDLSCGIGIETRELEKRGMKTIPLDYDLGFLKLIQNQFPGWLGNSQKGVAVRIALAAAGRKDFARKSLDLLGLDLEARGNRVLGAAEAIPLDDESVDAVVCKHYLLFGDEGERRNVLKEIERVLKPGGITLIFNEVRNQVLRSIGCCGHTFVGYPFNKEVLQRLIDGTSLIMDSYEEYPVQECDRFNNPDIRSEAYLMKETMAVFLHKAENFGII